MREQKSNSYNQQSYNQQSYNPCFTLASSPIFRLGLIWWISALSLSSSLSSTALLHCLPFPLFLHLIQWRKTVPFRKCITWKSSASWRLMWPRWSAILPRWRSSVPGRGLSGFPSSSVLFSFLSSCFVITRWGETQHGVTLLSHLSSVKPCWTDVNGLTLTNFIFRVDIC